VSLSFWKRHKVAPVPTKTSVPGGTPAPADLRWEPILANSLEGTRWWLDRHTVRQFANGELRIWLRIKDDDKPSVQFLRGHMRKEDLAISTIAVVIPDEAPPLIERREPSEWKTSEPGSEERSICELLWFQATMILQERAEKRPNIDGRWISAAGIIEMHLDLRRRGSALEGEADLITEGNTSRFRITAALTDTDAFVMELHRDPEPFAYFRLLAAVIDDGIILETVLVHSDTKPLPFTLRRPDDDFSPQYALNITAEQYHRGLPFDLLFTFTFTQLTDGATLSALHGIAEMVGTEQRQVLPIKGAIPKVLEDGARPSLELQIGDHYKFTGYLAETGVLRGFVEDHDHRLPMVIARQGNPEMIAAIYEDRS
jgi:hypothetical protein